MRYLALLALFVLCGCDWFAPPTPAADVPAIQTQTAALRDLATVRAAVFPPTPTDLPSATQTAIAAIYAQITATWGALYATQTAIAAPQP